VGRAEHALALGPAVGPENRPGSFGLLGLPYDGADLTDQPTAKADESLLDDEKLIRMGVI
jgi:hypothetical protein